MNQRINNKTKVLLKSFLVLALFALSIEAIAVWKAPTAGPTGGNIATPINSSNSDQIKSGGLTVGFFQSNGVSILTQDVDIGGTLTISSGTPGAGKILTSSNASGAASWSTFSSILGNTTINVTNGGTGLEDINANSVLVTTLANTLTPIALGNGESIKRATTGNGWTAYTPLSAGTVTSSGLTMTSGKLLGRYTTTPSTGGVQEITISTGLNLDSSGNLTATGTSLPSPSTDDTILVANGTAWQIKSIPDCDDVNGNHLNYDTTNNQFSCGNSASSAPAISGTLNPSSSSCVISVGASSCSSGTLTWTTTNPQGTSSVTNNGGATPSAPNGNNSSSAFTVPYNSAFSGVTTFYLYNNSVLLAQATVTTSCASGSVWNGTSCVVSSGGSFPVAMSGSVVGSSNGRGTTHIMNVPAGIVAGNLLIIIAAFDMDNPGGAVTGWPSGWNQLLFQNQSNGSTRNVMEVRWKIATGSETAFNVTTPVPSVLARRAIQFSNIDPSVPPQFAVTQGSSINPNSPSLTPSWGLFKTRWISALALDNGGLPSDNSVVSQYPSGYPLGNREATNGATLVSTGVSNVYTSENFEVASQNPGPHTLNASDFWIAATIAIKGAP